MKKIRLLSILREASILILLFLCGCTPDDCRLCDETRFDNSHNLSITDHTQFESVGTTIFAELCGNTSTVWLNSLGNAANPIIHTDITTGVSWIIVGSCE